MNPVCTSVTQWQGRLHGRICAPNCTQNLYTCAGMRRRDRYSGGVGTGGGQCAEFLVRSRWFLTALIFVWFLLSFFVSVVPAQKYSYSFKFVPADYLIFYNTYSLIGLREPQGQSNVMKVQSANPCKNLNKILYTAVFFPLSQYL